MTSAKYRQTLSSAIENHRLANFLQMDQLIDIKFLQSCLTDPAFSKSAPIEDLYQFKKQMGLLSFRVSCIQGQINERNLAPLGEFEDQVIEFGDLGIGTNVFECINPFNDPHSTLDILEGTLFEADRLSYANAGNIVIGRYTKLFTNHPNKKLVELFKNGQETSLSLKILESHFTEVH